MSVTEARGDYLATLVAQQSWPEVLIEEIADVNPRVEKASIPDDLPVSFVPMPAVGAGDGSIHVEETRPAGEVKKGFTPFLEGDVLFAKITPCMENGKMAVVPKLVNGYGFGSTEFHVLRPKSGMDAKYLYYYVSSQAFRGEAERHMTGAVGQRRVPTTYLKECTIPLAPLDQQKRIVAEIEKQFSRLDEAVANLKRAKANLKRYKAAVLKAAVEGRLVETEAELARREGRSYETGEQLLQRILETRRSQWQGKGKYEEPAGPDTSDLPELPEGWVWARLDAIAQIKGGIIVDKKRRDPTARPVPYLRVANVQRGYLDLTEIKYIDAPVADIAELRLMPGDVLFNEGGDRDKLGRGWIWEGQLPECIHQNHVFRARPVMDGVSGKLVSWWGNTFGKEYFLREGKQTTNLASINMTKLSALPVPIPPMAEQHHIVGEVDRRLSILHALGAELSVRLAQAGRLRSSILGQVFLTN